uniref:Uncharacterized protein n=1 Tax=Arundo donax TaxID=35708 RepID=A0A0A9DPA0_ARUDO
MYKSIPTVSTTKPTSWSVDQTTGQRQPRMRRLHECLAQRDGGRDGNAVEEDEDPGDVDELGLAGGRGAGALLHEPRLRGAHGQQEDGEPGHDVHGRRRGAGMLVRGAGEPEGDEAEQPLQAEEGHRGDAEPRVEAHQVRRHGRVVELERRVHAEDAQDQAHQVDQHVRHLLRPVVHRDRRVRQDGFANKKNETPGHHKWMDIEDLLGVLGLYVDAAPVMQQPDKHEDGRGQEQHVREHGHPRRHDGVVVAPDDPVRHGCRSKPSPQPPAGKKTIDQMGAAEVSLANH